MRVLEIIWQIFFCSFFSFSDFFVKRPDDGSGYPDGKVDSSGRPFSLSGRACLCDLLRGTMSGRYLSSVRTMNPIGLIAFSCAAAPLISFFFFGIFLSSCAFFLAFYVCFSHVLVLFSIHLHPRYVSLPFY
jgi:hypothetical protein